MTIEVSGLNYHLNVGDSIIIPPLAIHNVQASGKFIAQVVVSNSGGVADKVLLESPQVTERGQTAPVEVFRLAEFMTRYQTLKGVNYIAHTKPEFEVLIVDETVTQKRHFHKKATKIYSVLQGHMTIAIGDTEYNLVVGDTILINPRVI